MSKAVLFCDFVAATFERLGVSVAFGIPGIHNLSLYRSFQNAGMTIYDTRHEQGAAFMADGYARSKGRPAVCVLIDGPGFLNAATAIAQARADSIPMLVVTPGAPTNRPANTNGWLHELPGQFIVSQQIARASFQFESQKSIGTFQHWLELHLKHARPGPIHIEIPLDLMEHSIDKPNESASLPTPKKVDQHAIDLVSRLLNQSSNPLVLLGGGAVDAKTQAQQVIEALDAPCINTVNGKGILSSDHPLHVGGSPSLQTIRTAMYEADVLLAVGTEFGETDYGLLFLGPLSDLPNVVRIDIDNDQLAKNVTPIASIQGKTQEVLAQLRIEPKKRNGSVRCQELRNSLRTEGYFYPSYHELLTTINRSTDILVGDSSQPNYFAAWMYEPDNPRGYFHSVSGFGTLGYAIPAAVGAKLGQPNSRVTCLIGDGGAQFSLSEIRTAVVNKIGLPIVVWNSHGYEEINKAMTVRSIHRRVNSNGEPDFEYIARAMGAHYSQSISLPDLESALNAAHGHDVPTIVELHQSDFINEPIENWYS